MTPNTYSLETTTPQLVGISHKAVGNYVPGGATGDYGDHGAASPCGNM